MANAKKTVAKKAAAKKGKHYAYATPGVMNSRTDAPLYQTVLVTDADTIKRLDADPAVLAVSPEQAAQIEESNADFDVYDVREDLYREINELRGGINKMNAGDWVWAILIAGTSFGAGALLF